jgi:hypothetical protein
MSARYKIGTTTIGLIVRGKKNDAHSPGYMQQHADCILPGGEPVGFYGGGGDASSGSSGGSISGSINSWRNGPSISMNSTGMNMKGLVAYYDDLLRIRPMYVDVRMAKRYNSVSTVLLLDVSKTQADLFRNFWKKLKLNPGAFNILGGNCSTHAAEAFKAANVISSGIPGLDTPNNLYLYLKRLYAKKVRVYSGYIGAIHTTGDNYEMVIE